MKDKGARTGGMVDIGLLLRSLLGRRRGLTGKILSMAEEFGRGGKGKEEGNGS